MPCSPLTRALLYAPAKLYELGVRLRIALYATNYLKPRRLSAPVISVGNLTVGGTGKTPLVSFLARYLRDEGHHVAILSRGYKRASRGRVEVSNETEVLRGASEAGDEPYLLARQCAGVRVVVDKDRQAAGQWLAERAPVSAFILDDGFQHLGLARDLNLVLLDATEPLARAEMVPFGRLREPLTSLRRADAVIVTRADQPFDQAALTTLLAAYCRQDTPVFYAYHDLTGLRRLGGDERTLPAESSSSLLAPITFTRRPVAAISGIGRPDRFIADLRHFGMTIALRRDFVDHHHYTRAEFEDVVARARAAGAEAVITTEKDAVNLPAEAVRASPLPVYAARIEFRCEEEIALKGLVLRSLLRARKKGH
jgi:tetraacyldisaccharide 4'-kinase